MASFILFAILVAGVGLWLHHQMHTAAQRMLRSGVDLRRAAHR